MAAAVTTARPGERLPLGLCLGFGLGTNGSATLMGHLSDRTVSRIGRRRPCLALGAVLGVVVCASMLLSFLGTRQAHFTERSALPERFFQQLLTTPRCCWDCC